MYIKPHGKEIYQHVITNWENLQLESFISPYKQIKDLKLIVNVDYSYFGEISDKGKPHGFGTMFEFKTSKFYEG